MFKKFWMQGAVRMTDKHVRGLHKNPMRIKVFDEDQIHDISTYAINSSADNKFISTLNSMEFCIDDMQYLIIYGDVFSDIIDDIYQKGIEEGKKIQEKENYKSNNIITSDTPKRRTNKKK
jgi:hypothetical protein